MYHEGMHLLRAAWSSLKVGESLMNEKLQVSNHDVDDQCNPAVCEGCKQLLLEWG